jgi:uncharacterized damage-inducible protein DinB
MITVDYVQFMARYNGWQNASLYREARALDDAARNLDRGAFFGSIHATLSHLVFADQSWLHRFTAGASPAPLVKTIAESITYMPDWSALSSARETTDNRISAWAAELDPTWLEGPLTWYSGTLEREISRPRALLVAHMFNHQTHHRGQVHAMLTAAGRRPDATDMPFMP